MELQNTQSVQNRLSTGLKWAGMVAGAALLAGIFFTMSVYEEVSGVINDYAVVSYLSSDTVTVDQPGSFFAGDQVLLIQMKGVQISTANDSSYGNIQSLQGGGTFLLVTVDQVSGSHLILTDTICAEFDVTGGIQAVRVPVYEEVRVTGTLSAPDWDGQTGGVVAMRATEKITLEAGIDVQGSGFRGGSFNGSASSSSGLNYTCPLSSGKGGVKGEGITDVSVLGCQGHLGNGGGGGNDHNAGGGGGGGYARGGQGGHGWRSNSPGRLSDLDKGGFGGDGLRYFYDQARAVLFLGGGGGGGHQNNGATYPAGDGGGIVILIAPELEVDQHVTINASGEDAQDHHINDGASGGGGGGSIFLDIASISDANKLTIDVSGGDGATIHTRDQHGPGGGGGGGLIRTIYELSGVSITKSGGQPGLFVTNNNSNPLRNTPHGAGPGLDGEVLTGELRTTCPSPPYLDLDFDLGGTHSQADFTPQNNPARVFPENGQITLTSEEYQNLESMSFTLVNSQDGSDEYLGIDWPVDSLISWGLTVSYDSILYTLEIRGMAPIATYLKAAQGVIYGNRSGTPSVLDREIEASGYDGIFHSNTATAFVRMDQTSFPVEWLSFGASWQQGFAHLSWATAQEINSHYFVVERGSAPGEFEAVGEVTAAGTTTEISEYQFTDPGVSPGRSAPIYYRLKQVDLDGQFEYSQMVELQPEVATTQMAVKVYPNPMMESGTMSISSPEDGNLSWRIISIDGRMMTQGARQVSAGEQLIQLNVADWPAGTYYLNVNMGTQKQTVSFIKP